MEVTGLDINNLIKDKIVVYKEYKVTRGIIDNFKRFSYFAEKIGLDNKKELYVFSKGNDNLVISVDENINVFNQDLVSLINAVFNNIDEFYNDKVTIGGKNYFNLKLIIDTYNRILKFDLKDTDTVGKVYTFNEMQSNKS